MHFNTWQSRLLGDSSLYILYWKDEKSARFAAQCPNSEQMHITFSLGVN